MNKQQLKILDDSLKENPRFSGYADKPLLIPWTQSCPTSRSISLQIGMNPLSEIASRAAEWRGKKFHLKFVSERVFSQKRNSKECSSNRQPPLRHSWRNSFWLRDNLSTDTSSTGNCSTLNRTPSAWRWQHWSRNGMLQSRWQENNCRLKQPIFHLG